MQAYRLRDVERLLGVSRRTILAFVRHGFVTPARVSQGAYTFTFDDLLVLRVARDLARAAVPPERIARSLRRLRSNLLRAGATGEAVRLGTSGDRLVARAGAGPWQTDAGQLLLDLAGGPATAVERMRHATADALFGEAAALESRDPAGALRLYRQALSDDPSAVEISVNLGRLLHELGKPQEAEDAYRACLKNRPADDLRPADALTPAEPADAQTPADALLHFNLAVLLEDRGDPQGALLHYGAAVEADPQLADAHYNLSLLFDSLGDRRRALRHLRTYRRLLAGRG
jgi:tetratricopeptide (TPR) repeat protein